MRYVWGITAWQLIAIHSLADNLGQITLEHRAKGGEGVNVGMGNDLK